MSHTRYEEVLPALETKVADLQTLSGICLSPQALWAYCLQCVWYNISPQALPIHKVVAQIFAIQPADLQVSERRIGFAEVTPEELAVLHGNLYEQ